MTTIYEYIRKPWKQLVSHLFFTLYNRLTPLYTLETSPEPLQIKGLRSYGLLHTVLPLIS